MLNQYINRLCMNAYKIAVVSSIGTDSHHNTVKELLLCYAADDE